MIVSIYKITNKINQKAYIGYTKKLIGRKSDHKAARDNCYFHRAIKKYGWDNFQWEILYQSLDEEHTLNEMETYFIKEHHTHRSEGGYNTTWGGEGTTGIAPWNKGRKGIYSKEVLERNRLAHIGKPGPNRGRKFSLESREKMRLAKLGKTKSLDHRNKMKIAQMKRRERERMTA